MFFRSLVHGFSSVFRKPLYMLVSSLALGILTILMILLYCREYSYFDLCLADSYVLLTTEIFFKSVLVPLFAFFLLVSLRVYDSHNTILQFKFRRNIWMDRVGRSVAFSLCCTLTVVVITGIVGAFFSNGMLTNFSSKYGLFYNQTSFKAELSGIYVIAKCISSVFCSMLFASLLANLIDYFTGRAYLGLLAVLAVSNIYSTGWLDRGYICGRINCSYISFLNPEYSALVSVTLMVIMFILGALFARHKEFLK